MRGGRQLTVRCSGLGDLSSSKPLNGSLKCKRPEKPVYDPVLFIQGTSMEKNCPCVLFLLLPLQSASPAPLFPCNGIIRSRGEQGNKCRALNPSRTIKGLTKVLVHLHNGPLLLWKHIKKSWFDCWELRVNSIPRITVRISIIFSIKYSCSSHYHQLETCTWKAWSVCPLASMGGCTLK